jgi:hypothetical protein
MTANHQRDFDRLLTRSIQQRVASGSRVQPNEDELAATRAELEQWIDEQSVNEDAGTFDWELGRRINAAKRQFSADSLASELHNPSWCRDRACRAESCVEARRLPRASVSVPAGDAPRTVPAHRVDPATVWSSHDQDSSNRRWWRSADR